MKNIQISPSILSADFSQLGKEIKRLEDGGADLIHVDVMDGHFVPNITIGPPVIKTLRNYTKLPFDVHLMISPVHKYIKNFNNWICVFDKYFHKKEFRILFLKNIHCGSSN